ncbi:aminotransferase class V-fold PLP-dependent enzyme [Candidatus Peregrinibacteria bacterium]|nr:MAG: aminotransferase class V-fold PLP-dependent enzyme [Candidatus Peregrinibacteria bacterium]
MKTLDFVKLVGPQDAKHRGSIVSFTIDGIHPHDIAEGLSNQNICIRGGHHCAQVLMDQLGFSGTARLSLAFYNEKEEVDVLLKALVEIYDYFN